MLYMWHAWDKPLLVTAVSLELFTRSFLPRSRAVYSRNGDMGGYNRLVGCGG
jgi:hypothetical protein